MNTKKSRRVTISLDDDLSIKLRKIQSKLIKETTSLVSFSKVLNDILCESLTKT
jgi:hypothetical protein